MSRLENAAPLICMTAEREARLEQSMKPSGIRGVTTSTVGIVAKSERRCQRTTDRILTTTRLPTSLLSARAQMLGLPSFQNSGLKSRFRQLCFHSTKQNRVGWVATSGFTTSCLSFSLGKAVAEGYGFEFHAALPQGEPTGEAIAFAVLISAEPCRASVRFRMLWQFG